MNFRVYLSLSPISLYLLCILLTSDFFNPYTDGYVIFPFEVSEFTDLPILWDDDNLSKISSVVGKNTKSAVRSGFYWGYIGLVQNIIDKISKQTKKNYKVILTGGFSHLFAKSFKQKVVIDKDITIKGLQKITELLWKMN